MPGRAHADRNEKLCDLLLEKGGFDDWVVTAAFYAAIHLVDHQIFPLTVGVEPIFANFNQYCNRKITGMAPHKVRRHLVTVHLSACADAFDWLYDACQNSRYNNYQVPTGFAAQAKKKLTEIKKVCTKA